MAKFNLDIGALLKKKAEQAKEVQVAKVENVLIYNVADMVDGTPMGIPNSERSPSADPRGNVQFNWQSGRSVNSRVLKSGGGRNGLQFAEKAIRGKLAKGRKVFIFNNHPAITTLEYGGYPNPPKKGTYRKGRGYERRSSGGFSNLAPRGMVRIALRRIRSRLERF